ncbi:glycosyltransferase family 4 protein [Salinibius halmophilus]|uniref:glycosyltransferase family 4 protein n=1 Tax=Salinibius halmophilus TaxID=1853216 RepID=UPI000E6761A9|nr:glycosyltransferase family 4 protein [Salinibius halmophilus]
MNNILLVSEIFPPTHGGSGRWFKEIYSRVSNANVHYLVGCHERRINEGNITPYNLGSDQWGVMNFRGLVYYIRSSFKVLSVCRKHKTKQLHLGRAIPEGAMALLAKKFLGISMVSYIHGEDVLTARQSREHSAIVSTVLKNSDTIICNSKNTKSIIEKHWPKFSKKLVVLNPGVDTDYFRPSETNINTCNKFKILTVGRLQQRKGQDYLIEAIAHLRDFHGITDIQYDIVGDGPDRAAIKGAIEKNSAHELVNLHGALEDSEILAHYQACDLFAMTNRRIGSDDEGFGLVYLEAQACGKPVLSGESGGVLETFESGKTGFSVNAITPENISEKLLEIYKNRATLTEMGIAAREHVERTYDWSILAKRLEDIIEEVK